MYVCKIVDDHRQKYAEIDKDCLWIEISTDKASAV